MMSHHAGYETAKRRVCRDRRLPARLWCGQAKRMSYQASAKLFNELFRWLQLALRDIATWQSPLALLTKWHRKEFAQCQFVFLAICRNADRDGVLRDVSPQ